jgi:hypothetical protein
MITVSFRTDTAAFDPHARAEAARLLRIIAQRVADGHRDGVVVDLNGAKVGAWSLADHREG